MNSSAGVSDRFGMPFYRLVEWVLPYGRRLRADLDRVHRFSRELLREALDEIREEELGKKEVKEGKGLLVRALMASGVGMSVEEMADSCLNFLTAGQSPCATYPKPLAREREIQKREG
jgi:cytochrome P450